MPLQTFRHYTICQDQHGNTVEVWRGNDEVSCLAFDNNQHCFVELHVAIGPAERQRDAPAFQNLVQLAAPLRHRHLLGIIEGGEDEGANYHISEFLDGERLDTWLARAHPLPAWLALLIIRQLVEGLAALASHPRLLAGVEVFHAGLTLTGPHPDDLTVKLCDLGLSGTLPASTDPHFVEARAIHDTGRLLLYMLTGSLTQSPVTAESLAGRNIPPELAFLLGTIFSATAPHHPRTLEQLRTLTERCAHDLSPELTARPDLLPANFRPRLPLTPHIPDTSHTPESLSNDFTLDSRIPDAADPYRQRGTQRATRRPVNLQILPPPNLLPPEFFQPALDQAWTTLTAPGKARDPHLLTPLAWHPEAPAPLLVEELPGKFTLETLRRLRHPLDPEETFLLLTQLDAAATAAASRHLPLHWRSPRLIPVHFPGGEESLPPPAQLARLPLTQWPAFTLKVRTWPITLDFTQPDRFHLERLLPRDPALHGEPPPRHTLNAAGQLPTARDFALLTTWLLGGTAQLKDNLKSLLLSTIKSRPPGSGTREEFLERFRQRLTGAPILSTTPLILQKPTTPVATITLGKGKSGKARLKTNPVPLSIPNPAPKENPAKPEATPVPTASLKPSVLDSPTPPASPELTEPDALENFPIGRHAPLPEEEETELPTLGFAEALFGSPDPDQAESPNAKSSAPNAKSSAPNAKSSASKAKSKEKIKKSKKASSPTQTPTPDPDPTQLPPPLWPILSDPENPSDPYAPFPTHESPDPAFPPMGFMEAAGQSTGWDPDHDPDQTHRSGSPWMLLLIVLLIAAALAALMAQLTGQAIWLK